jgi:hypothetical protein
MKYKYYYLVSIIISLVYIHDNFPQSYWSEQTIIPTPPGLNCVSANIYDGMGIFEGWIGGDSGTILYTYHGDTWLYRNNNVVGNYNVNAICSIGFPPSGRAVCAVNSSSTTYIYLSTNQGLNWTMCYQQAGGRIRSFGFTDNNTGYAIGDPVAGRWTILKTSNGGVSFDSTGLYLQQNGSEISNYNSMYVASNPNLFFFGTNNGRLYLSTNFGINWNPIILPFQSIYAITLGLNEYGYTHGFSKGYAAGNGAVYSSDSGRTWNTVTLPGTGDIHAFNYGGNTCYAKGSEIYASTNSSQQFFLQYTSPNGGNYTGISFSYSQFEYNGYLVGWAVKDNGTVSKFYEMIVGIKKLTNTISESYSLSQNYPNPFNPSTKIRFDIAPLLDQGGVAPTQVGDGVVTLKVYDLLGREITTLVNQPLQPGTYEVEWDGTNYPSGVYFYSYTNTKKLVLLK